MTDLDHEAKPEARPDVLTEAWERDPGAWGWLTAVNHKRIGMRFMVTAGVFFLVGGILALLIRTQLAVPENSFLSAELYNQIFTMHGTTMMFLFAVPAVEGLAIYLLPLMLGSRDLPFPRLNAFGYWLYLFGGLLVFSSFVVGDAPDQGWFAYVPLAGSGFSPDQGVDFWLLGVTMVEISGIVGGLEIVTAFFKHRSPGMSLDRVPLFGWATMVASGMIVVAFPSVVTASSLLELERATGLVFFEPTAGGDPLLWQHLFWFFGHPEVYIMLLPAVGVVSMVVPVFARRSIAGYGWVVAAVIAIGVASFGLWVHHMFTAGLPSVALAFFSAASVLIAIPSGVLIFSWLATLRGGRPVFRTPLLFVLGFVVVFVMGGITGVMVASVPFDLQVHDSFFVVAHFHYVLIGGVVFPLFAALYYWLPKWSGRMPSPSMGRWSFWTMLVGVNLAFFPQHFLGMQGMPRRIFTYPVGLGWELGNLLSTIGALVLATGVAIAVIDLVRSLRRGQLAGENPWHADSLEWATSSPPPVYNFRDLPLVESSSPLWGTEPPVAGGVDHPDWIDELSDPSEPVREILETAPVSGESEAVVRLPSGSPWPLLGAVGIAVAFIGLLGSWPVVTWTALAVTVVSLISWAAADPHVRHVGERAGEVHTEGPVRSTSTLWGLAIGMVSLATILGSLLFAYWMLAGTSPWPPPDSGQITLADVALGGVLLLLAVGTTSAAARLGTSEKTGPATAALAAASVLALAFAATTMWAVLGSIGPVSGSSYASIVVTLFAFVALLGAFLAAGLVALVARISEVSPAAAISHRAASIFAVFLVAAWIVVVVVVMLGQLGTGSVP